MKLNRWVFRGTLVLLLAMLMAGGCATDNTRDQRLARYSPDGSQRRLWEWGHVSADADAVVTQAADVAVDPLPNGADFNGEVYTSKGASILRRGDGITVYLKGIPRPEDLREEVDETGAITLPLVGELVIAGMLTSQAEDAIERAYIDRGYYKKINVIVVAEEGGYYVRGEVKRVGRYPISGDVTLVQAIITAGGFTDFAKRSKVKVIRDQEEIVYNVDRIEDGKDQDPLIKANDTIIVLRRRF